MKRFLLCGLSVFALLMFSQAVSAGNPINTTAAGLFAYYQLDNREVDIQQLALDSTIWNCSEDGGRATFVDAHYVEGNICLDPERLGMSEDSGGAGYNVVTVRVKRDGWIMAYLNYLDYPHLAGQVVWNKDRQKITGPNNDDFQVVDLSLGDAMKNVMSSVYINEVYTGDDISYYHFQHPTWTKIRIFGNGMYHRKSTEDDVTASVSEYVNIPELTVSFGQGDCGTSFDNIENGQLHFNGSSAWYSGCLASKRFYRGVLTSYLNDPGLINTFEPRDRDVHGGAASNVVFAAIFAVEPV